MLTWLPAANATLNAIAFVLLILGWRRIRSGDREGHKRLMLSAFSVSSVFLVGYVTYRIFNPHIEFPHQGAIRWVYYGILITHVPLAMLMVVPILILIRHGLAGRIDRHRRLARIVFPVWVYVSITGVMIYLMLHHL